MGDCPLLRPETLRGLLQRHEESGCAATLITTLLDNPTGYGRIIREKDGPDGAGQVLEIVEEKAATAEQKQIREINSGLYRFERAAAAAPRRPGAQSGLRRNLPHRHRRRLARLRRCHGGLPG